MAAKRPQFLMGSGTRELVIPKTPYIVPYRLRGSTIEIVRVYHSSRRWPERL
jgi:toxin ParE1/3/4